MRANGYLVTAMEMTDPDDTPKNTLLRGIKRDNFSPASKEGKQLMQEYQDILTLVLGAEGAATYLEEIRL